MRNNLKLNLMKLLSIILICILGLELKIIALKNQKELEKQKQIEESKEVKKDKEKNSVVNLLSLENDFNISRIENNDANSWSGNINFNESLEEGIKKVKSLTKKDFTITNYTVEYKDGYGNFNLKIRAGD